MGNRLSHSEHFLVSSHDYYVQKHATEVFVHFIQSKKWSTKWVQGDQGQSHRRGAPAGHSSVSIKHIWGPEDCPLLDPHQLQASHLLIPQKTRETRPKEPGDTCVQTAGPILTAALQRKLESPPRCSLSICSSPVSKQSLPLPPATQLTDFLSSCDNCDFVESVLHFH